MISVLPRLTTHTKGCTHACETHTHICACLRTRQALCCGQQSRGDAHCFPRLILIVLLGRHVCACGHTTVVVSLAPVSTVDRNVYGPLVLLLFCIADARIPVPSIHCGMETYNYLTSSVMFVERCFNIPFLCLYYFHVWCILSTQVFLPFMLFMYVCNFYVVWSAVDLTRSVSN